MATADLHLHTRYSDGTETPQRVVELAVQAGLAAIAITDHDIVDSYEQALPFATAQGLELIPGLEMSAGHMGPSGEVDVHVLGLFINVHHAPFQQRLAEQRTRRIRRTHEMVERLRGMGLAITVEEVFAAAGEGAVGRPHVAQVLLDHGYVATSREAFDKYIGNNGPAYIAGSPTPPKDAIRAILDAGGIPVLAHPVYIKNDALIEQWTRDGLVGLEVYHSSHTPEVVNRYKKLADRLGLLKTGGSDFHGTSREGVPIGTATVPYEMVEALKAWKAAHPTP